MGINIVNQDIERTNGRPREGTVVVEHIDRDGAVRARQSVGIQVGMVGCACQRITRHERRTAVTPEDRVSSDYVLAGINSRANNKVEGLAFVDLIVNIEISKRNIRDVVVDRYAQAGIGGSLRTEIFVDGDRNRTQDRLNRSVRIVGVRSGPVRPRRR